MNLKEYNLAIIQVIPKCLSSNVCNKSLLVKRLAYQSRKTVALFAYLYLKKWYVHVLAHTWVCLQTLVIRSRMFSSVYGPCKDSRKVHSCFMYCRE